MVTREELITKAVAQIDRAASCDAGDPVSHNAIVAPHLAIARAYLDCAMVLPVDLSPRTFTFEGETAKEKTKK